MPNLLIDIDAKIARLTDAELIGTYYGLMEERDELEAVIQRMENSMEQRGLAQFGEMELDFDPDALEEEPTGPSMRTH